MNKIDFTHPFHLLNYLISHKNLDLNFEFGIYKHINQRVSDERKIFKFSSESYNITKIEEIITSLPDGYELALHSIVRLNNKKNMHIPMIDFINHFSENNWDLIFNILPKVYSDSLVIYDSGRSYHGYCPLLIDDNEWARLMGVLLLINFPGKNAIIDTRWIGHRLIGGYGSLRWSKNTNGHKILPKLILPLTRNNEFISYLNKLKPNE